MGDPSAASVAGTLVGRAATAPAGKPFYVDGDRQRARYIEWAEGTAEHLADWLDEYPSLDEEARRADDAESGNAGSLRAAADAIAFAGRAACDSGGPAWSKAWDDAMGLDPDGLRRVTAALRRVAGKVAGELMSTAAEEGWRSVWAEAGDGPGWLDRDPVSNRRNWRGDQASVRPDLMVQIPDAGGARSRLILDLKLRGDLSETSVETALSGVVRRYGVHFADRLGKPVACVVLGYDWEGDVLWSSERVVTPTGGGRRRR